MRFASSLLGLFAFAAPVVADPPVDYLRDVKPIFKQHCTSCHSATIKKAGLRLDKAAHVLQGSGGGAIVVPGKSKESALIDSLHGANGMTRMPHKAPPLSAKQIAILTAWIDAGAKIPSPDEEIHWAFKAPVRTPLPVVSKKQWAQNAIDLFVLAKLDQHKISPSPESAKVTLVRRLYLDLLGLPPTIAEVAAYLSDTRPDAYEKLVDKLLASPHYGERWGRHWLDLARYGDTHGYTIDAPREIWKYRDWVIDALNADLPFNQFVIQQMAGDMLPGATLEQKIATGFHRNTLINQEGGIDVEQFRIEAVADRVNTTGTVFLGLSLGCARCHDHKYDPISTKEYYQLFAFLNNQTEPTLNLASPEVAAKRQEIRAKMEKIEDDLNPKMKNLVQALSDPDKAKAPKDLTEILNLRPDQRTDKQKQVLATYFKAKGAEFKKPLDDWAKLAKEEPKFPTTMVLQEMPKPRETFVQIAGDFTRKGAKVAGGVPAVLHALTATKPNRLDLAKWIVDPKNPLLARVTVNRIWQQYFGRGIVETENDFGLQGVAPTHPELLDWLALEFIEGGWSLKKLHRIIVTSATYKQSSKARPDLKEIDPDNKLLARQVRLRLDAEIVRDNALAVSGLLTAHIGGPSVFPPQPDGIYQFTQVQRPWKTSMGAERYRRGMYTFLQRSAPFPALTVFDAPDGTSTCTKRVRSNTPLQALTLLNDQAFLELARGLAARLLKEGPSDDRERLTFAFRLCLARPPSAKELDRLEAFLTLQLREFTAAPAEAQALLTTGMPKGSTVPEGGDVARWAAWTSVARVLINLDEFITRE